MPRPWEKDRPLPPRMATAFEIMRDGPIGAAAFNNEFGRPCLGGYFRTFEAECGESTVRRGYDKPIMIAGGLANLRASDVQKRHLQAGDAVIVLGGPAMLIGLGGGAASSVAGGDSSAELDFASVQRDNAEMERRCQQVIDACWMRGDKNPIVSVHDVGAGGLSNAIPEILNDSGVGGAIELRKIPSADPQLSPMQIWCNEAQERYVLGLKQADVAEFEAMCERERCPFAVVGTVTAERKLQTHRFDNSRSAIRVISSSTCRWTCCSASRRKCIATRSARAKRMDLVPDLDGILLEAAIKRVLRQPAVGSKSFLITIGDRTVGGLCSRDPMVGPWQVPVADCAVTLSDFDGYAGEAMAMGERTPLAVLSAPASARMAVGEAITNLASAAIDDHRRNQTFRELDGRGQRAGRRRETVRCRASRRHGTLSTIKHFHSGRQGFAVDADRLAAGRPPAQDGGAGVADRDRVRAHERRAQGAHAAAAHRSAAKRNCG